MEQHGGVGAPLAQPPPAPQPDLHRVKLYKLNETGGWDDKGTGLVSVGPMECSATQSNTVGLCVISEETSKMLMVHRILQDDSYNRQDETIITWTDPDIGTDVALSFQEAHGCGAIWEHIMRAQSDSDPKHPDHRRRVIDEYDGVVSHVDGEYLHHELGDVGAGMQLELPAAELSNLEELAKVLGHVPPVHRERVAALLMAPGYLGKLLDLFRQCEDLEDTGSLHQLFRVMRCMVMLNDTQLLDELLKEEHVMGVIGCLEYDPDVGGPQGHRAFLQTAVVFKEVVPITSQEVLAKIHQTYRIQYLKDVILPRSLDDATYATLSSLMLFNNVDVVLGLAQDSTFLPRLFHALQSHEPGDAHWDDLVAFLQEFCGLAKHLQLQHRQTLWNKMSQLGMFEVLTRILQSSAPPVKLRATDILLSALAHDPGPLRAFLATPGAGHQLLDCLVAEFVGSRDSGLPEQIAELLKLLMDPETMEGSLEKSAFMEVFYTTCIDKLIEPVSASADGSSSSQQQQQQQPGSSAGGPPPEAAAAAADGGPPQQQAPAVAAAAAAGGAAGGASAAAADGGGGADVPASTLGLIVDLLCFCVQHHAFWAKYHVLRKHIVEKVLRLLRRRERWLVVASVRFLRTCIGTKDDFYLRHLIKFDLLAPVMAAFFGNGERYNLLNSAVLEMVEFVRKENLKLLIEYMVERFGPRFDEVTYVDTFKQLQLKWEQSKEAAEAAAAGGGGSGGGAEVPGGVGLDGLAGGLLHPTGQRRMRRDDRDLEKDEEDYFSEDSIMEADDAPAAAAAGGDQQPFPQALRPLGGDAGGSSSRGGGGLEPRVVIKGLFKPQALGDTAAAAAGPGGGGMVADVAAAAAAGGLLAALVPYGDDDEDAENAPPPTAAAAAAAPASSSPPQQQQHEQQHVPFGQERQQPAQQQGQQGPGQQQQQQPQWQQLAPGNNVQTPHQQQQHQQAPLPAAGHQQHGSAPVSPASAASLSPDAAGISSSPGGDLTPSKRCSSSSSGHEGAGGGGSDAAAGGLPHSPQAKRAKAPSAADAAASPHKQQQPAADAARA